MEPHNDDINWQTWVLAAMTAAILGVSLGMASARPHPKLPACDAVETRQRIHAGLADDPGIEVFGLHSLQELYSIDEGRGLRRCSAIAVTDQGERRIKFYIGWLDLGARRAFWAGPHTNES